jgi:NitT/TauT family transport system substrate-binding protein
MVGSLPVHAATSTDRVALRIGALPLDASAEAFYAKDMGFFDEAGIDATVTVMPNGSSLLAALAAKDLDIGFSSPGTLINARDHGLKMRFFCPGGIVVVDARTAYSGLLVAKDSQILSAADLAGKTIGVAGIKDITQFSVQAWIDSERGNADSVQFTEIPYSAMIPALEQGRVAAIAEPEPFLTMAKRRGARLLGNLDATMGRRYLITGWIINEDWPQFNSEGVSRFVAAMRRTARWANLHRSESAAILIKYSKLDPDIASTMTRALYDDSGRVDPRLLQGPLNMLIKYGKISLRSPAELVWPPGRDS